jgi:hypothetical protein
LKRFSKRGVAALRNSPLSVGTAQALAPLRAISATSIYATSLLVEAVKVAKERCHSPMQSTKIVDYQNLIF